jgi:hypothetical protein
MTKIAILDETLPAQVAENPDDLEGIEVVWAGADADELCRRVTELRPHVVVCALELLGPDPTATLARLEAGTEAELVILLYQFARRTDLRQLESDKRRVVQAPLSVARLRSQMMSVVVKQLLGGGGERSVRVARAARPAPAATPPRPAGGNAPRRFTREQLGRLAEISTAIDCECPHHLSQLVSSLVAFEEYSARCESRDDEDAAMHRLLHRETGRARALMEEALAELVAHENIALRAVD